jgi:hypothetical protein
MFLRFRYQVIAFLLFIVILVLFLLVDPLIIIVLFISYVYLGDLILEIILTCAFFLYSNRRLSL